ncbi:MULTISPECIES: hypothetical protein [unclassified Psychrobacter]|uniref:hypothetical protein n=1 Tax=unclassified Psychrobacter TaxID=196806 RepID=UPI003FD27051
MAKKATIHEIMHSIDKLKLVSDRTKICLDRMVEPLNERLEHYDMMVWWDGEEYMINQTAADKSIGISFNLDDEKLLRLMLKTDRTLLRYCKNWG